MLFFGMAGKTHAAISFVQGDTETPGGAPTSSPCYLSSPVSQGDLIVGISQLGNYNRSESLSDSIGNSYSKLSLLNSASSKSDGQVVLWYATSTASSSDTLTFALNSGGTFENFMCAEYSGLSNLQPFDAVTGTTNSATSTSLSSGPVTTATSSELLLGFGGGSNDYSSPTTFTSGAGYTLRLQGPTSTNNARSFLEDEISGAVGSYAATATSSFASYWFTGIAAFSTQNQSCELAGSCYIVPGGTGINRGLDWNNAYADLPATLSCGVNYYLAGGAYDYTSVSKTWTTDCPSTSPIHIYKAIAAGPGNPDQVAGWQASYGTSQAIFSQTTDPDPEKVYSAFFDICGSNYTIDGVIPISGTPSSTTTYGIVVRSKNRGGGIAVGATTSGCGAGNKNPTNVTLEHIEYDGVSPEYGVQILSGSRFSNIVTLTLASAPAWVAGDTIDLYNASTTDFNIHDVSLASVSGTVITYAQSGPDETLTTTTQTYVTLNYSGSVPVEVSSTTSTPDNIIISDSYMHDFISGILVVTCNTCYVERNFVARNRSTPTQHQNGIEFHDENHNVYVADNILEDITGTSDIDHVGGSGPDTNFFIYNNLIFCSTAAESRTSPYVSPQCGVSSSIGDDNGEEPVTGAFVYGNTVTADANGACQINFGSVSSTATVENNLFYNCASGGAYIVTGSGGFEDYNTSIGQIWTSYPMPSPGPHDYSQATGIDPFVNDAAGNFALLSDTIDPHLNDGTVLSSPYNLDLTGATRGAGGTWDRGTYQYIQTDFTPPSVPTNLSAIAVSTSGIDLSWTASTDPIISGQTTSGVAGYQIFRNGSQIATTTQVSYQDTGLAASTGYIYTVSAYDNANNISSQSASASATTQSPTFGCSCGGGGGGGGGYSSPVVLPGTTNLPQSVEVPATSQASSTPSLITLKLINATGTFYLIINSVRHGITNPGMLTTYGFTFAMAKPASPADLLLPEGSLLTPGDGALVKSQQDPTVYFISNQQRHGFTSAAVFAALSFKFSSVLIVTATELNKLPQGSNLDNPLSAHPEGVDINDHGTIYWIHNNQRYIFPSLMVYNSLRVPNDFSRVVPANAADRQLPLGAVINPRVLE
jgi:hypothetical protein